MSQTKNVIKNNNVVYTQKHKVEDIIPKDKYVLEHIKLYLDMKLKNNAMIEPTEMYELMRQFEFDYDMNLEYNIEKLLIK